MLSRGRCRVDVGIGGCVGASGGGCCRSIVIVIVSAKLFCLILTRTIGR